MWAKVHGTHCLPLGVWDVARLVWTIVSVTWVSSRSSLERGLLLSVVREQYKLQTASYFNPSHSESNWSERKKNTRCHMHMPFQLQPKPTITSVWHPDWLHSLSDVIFNGWLWYCTVLAYLKILASLQCTVLRDKPRPKSHHCDLMTETKCMHHQCKWWPQEVTELQFWEVFQMKSLAGLIILNLGLQASDSSVPSIVKITPWPFETHLNPWWKTTLMRDHPGERPSWWQANMVRDHSDERPPWWAQYNEKPAWWQTTLMRDQYGERPPRWQSTLMRDQYGERPPRWQTTLVTDHLDERPIWRKTTPTDHLDKRPP